VILHRTHLFVPAARADVVEKAARFPADVLCLDLEESVPPAEKSKARENAHEGILALSQRAGATVHVRLNSNESGYTRGDLVAVVQPGLDGVLLAKTQSPQDVRDVDVLLREQELARGIKPGAIGLIVAIESARALLRCEEICRASTRLVALMLGGEDFAFDMGVQRTRAGVELDYARSVIATCARAAGILAFDTPFADIQDIDGLMVDAERARTLGFSGKYVIHPSHIDPVNRVYSPSEEQVASARKVLDAWEGARSDGGGAFQLDGKMVDRPIAERARRVIAQAEAITRKAR
jgi:citrate lyase subunit beta / citryl-CoA lyase